jgi:hypothetical protein
MRNRCGALRCGNRIKPDFLMCGEHWALVPQPIKDEVWAAFRKGDRDGSLEACMKATMAVAEIEAELEAEGPLDAAEIARRR